jgi:hypothetical protein
MEKNKILAPEAGQDKSLSFNTRYFGRAVVVKDTYQNGDKLSVELIDEGGELIAVLSVNIPEFSHLLGENEFFVKTWSENQEIAEDALASGIFRNTGRKSDGFLDARIWTFR